MFHTQLHIRVDSQRCWPIGVKLGIAEQGNAGDGDLDSVGDEANACRWPIGQ